MDDPARCTVLGDIGGTHARFAWATPAGLEPVETLPVADYSGFDRALAAFLDRHRHGRPVSGAVFAVAGPVVANRGSMTNSGWIVDGAHLAKTFNLPSVRVVNDFEPLAWSLPALAPSDLLAIGAGRHAVNAPAVVLGPGTGLGLACFVPRPDGAFVIDTEGGHATLAASTAREDRVIAWLRERFGHVSGERALSGPGLVNLYQALAAIDRRRVPSRDASEITDAACHGDCPTCREAVEMFCAMLGAVAGDAALMFGARGGVYIGGGIVPQLSDVVVRSQFRARFEAKGRFQAYVAAIASCVVMHRDPAFIGLQRLARQAFAR